MVLMLIQNDRYARMLEIKNVVNREINGIPNGILDSNASANETCIK